jgi:chemotaxis response regulator CheB
MPKNQRLEQQFLFSRPLPRGLLFAPGLCPLALIKRMPLSLISSNVTEWSLRQQPAKQSPPFIVAIGASGGEGLTDIKDLLAALPIALPAVVLVVFHRPSDQISHLMRIPGIAARDSD